MLKQVLLPAPFGPIRATTSPASTARSTPATAATPPKRLAMPSAARTGSKRLGLGRAPPEEAGEPLGEGEDQEDDRQAEQEAPELEAGERGLEQRVGRGANQRAARRLHAAEQHHHERVEGAADRGLVREHAALGVEVEPTGEAGAPTR